ncbi:Secreted protein containing C-terminal beta-propeller domain [Lachnospiraceae bacterium NE2001]|nr:Secreted protein containing C-terminal beta-propeller domain [Lachnospiraceae bacterium NE2001]
MADIDNIFEEQLKSSVEQLPDSLRPENIEGKLASMTVPEKYSRSRSEDIPMEDIKVDRSGGKGKYIIPIILAAGVLLAAGVGLGVGLSKNRYLVDSDPAIESSQLTDKDDTAGTTTKNSLFSKKEKTDNYEMAYEYFKSYKDYLDDQYKDYDDYVDYDMVEESADADGGTNQYNAGPTVGASSAATASATGGSEKSESYTDTNVRTEGVAEADIVKTDGKYIYEYDTNTEHLNFYSVNDGSIQKEGRVNVLQDDYYFKEMYIVDNKLVLLGTNMENYYYSYWYNSYYDYQNAKTYVAIYDISDKGEPELIDEYEQSGSYDSSRMVDGVLYTFSKKSFDLDKLKKKDYDTYIPDVDGEFIDNDDLYVQKDIFTTCFEVITSLDIKKGKYIDKMAILAGSDTMYVSSDSIFLTDYTYSWSSFSYGEETKVLKISYDDGELEYETKGTFPGYLNDDYSIDEYDGYLRLVTTYRDSNYTQYNALYVYDSDLNKVSVIKNLAEGETIRSARFMGKTAYFVTFRNTDPLFAVDLSDPENPEITDYLKIPGFSAYLHPYGENKLLGIGYDTDETGWINCIKLTMFDVTDPYDIVEEDTEILYNYQQAGVLNDRRALMYNSEDGTFGFSTYAEGYYYLEEDWFKEDYEDVYDVIVDQVDENKLGPYYMVWDYDEDDGFQILMDEALSDSSSEDYYYSGDYSTYANTRGIVIGDYIYVVIPGEGVKSYDTNNYKLVDECD